METDVPIAFFARPKDTAPRVKDVPDVDVIACALLSLFADKVFDPVQDYHFLPESFVLLMRT